MELGSARNNLSHYELELIADVGWNFNLFPLLPDID
jgi:hypothetical protein